MEDNLENGVGVKRRQDFDDEDGETEEVHILSDDEDEDTEEELDTPSLTPHSHSKWKSQVLYENLNAFLRIYLRCDSKATEMTRTCLYNLYLLKLPESSRIAKNSFFRFLKSYLKDRSDKGEYVDLDLKKLGSRTEKMKGLRIIEQKDDTDQLKAEWSTLQRAGVNELFGFDLNDLNRPDSIPSDFDSRMDNIHKISEKLSTGLQELNNIMKSYQQSKKPRKDNIK